MCNSPRLFFSLYMSEDTTWSMFLYRPKKISGHLIITKTKTIIVIPYTVEIIPYRQLRYFLAQLVSYKYGSHLSECMAHFLFFTILTGSTSLQCLAKLEVVLILLPFKLTSSVLYLFKSNHSASKKWKMKEFEEETNCTSLLVLPSSKNR